MTALLVLTVGQTDVQLVENGARRELAREKCASLHEEIERREAEWHLADCPRAKLELPAVSLPKGRFELCTPKLDALLQYMAENGAAFTAALILETRRDAEPRDPRFAGAVLACRLREGGVREVWQRPFLAGSERLEDTEQPRDAVIRREVVNRIDAAVRETIAAFSPQRVIVATTGGLPVVGNLVEEVVRLITPPGAIVDMIEVADGAKAKPPAADRAISRHRTPEPAASYQARRHALELIANGNLLGAWGAVQHLDSDEIEHRWTRVIEWLAHFAASTPMPDDCDIPVLMPHTAMAVRAAIRVELALRAQDVPRAVHGTVAFFESALWDHLGPHLSPHPESKRRLFRADPLPSANLIREISEDRGKPFENIEEPDGARWYRVFDDDVCGIRLAKHYLKQEPLEKLGQAVSSVRELRNDVAHNEPTPRLMAEARSRMTEASLWSAEGRFLSMPFVQGVLRDLGEQNPDRLCTDLISTVRSRLLEPLW